jgi:hypothetical protein
MVSEGGDLQDLDDVRWELSRFGKVTSATAREQDAAAPSRGWCR